MKLIDIAAMINKHSNNEDDVDTEELGYELGVNDVPYVNQERVTCYWVGSWWCTDSLVGYRMYFFDGQPVAFSSQSGRKSDEHFRWFSEEAALAVKHYLISLLEEKEDRLNVETIDIHENIGDCYRIEFSSQIPHTENAYFNGEKITILNRIKNKPYGIDTELKIQLPNGEEKHVDVTELQFKFYTEDGVS